MYFYNFDHPSSAVFAFIQKGKLTFTRCNRKVNTNKISKRPAEVPIRHNQHALDTDRYSIPLLSFLLVIITFILHNSNCYFTRLNLIKMGPI